VVSALLAAALLLSEGTSKVYPPSSERAGAPNTYVFAQTQRVDVGGGATSVSAETNVPTPRRGYFPLRLFVDNSTGPTQSIKLGYYPSNNTGRPITKDVEVRQGERRTVILAVPYLFRYGNVRARGPGISKKGDAHVYFNSTYAPQRPLLSIGTTDEFERWVDKPPAHTDGDLSVYSIAADEAPTELAAYAGYDTVAIPAAAFESLNEAQRRALESYAATGGTLVLGKGGRGLAAALPLMKEGKEEYGFGRLVVVDGQPDFATVFNSTTPVVSPRASPRSMSGRVYRYVDANPGSDFTALLPQATAPIGRFLLIIGLFTLAIGPGSIWVARRRGPAMLLLTIPGTAFITCTVIIGYSLIQDGFTVHASTQGLTWLDSKQHRALQVGLTAYYANLAPGSARFSSLTVVVPPQEGSGEVYAPGIEWNEGATMGSDFVPSRTYREWGYVSAEPTRARVLLKKKDGAWVVQNALGSRVVSMVFMADDRLWMVADLRDGAEATGAKQSGGLPHFEGPAANRFSAELQQKFAAPLKEGEFLATVEGQGFTPSGGLRLTEHDSGNLVRGEVER